MKYINHKTIGLALMLAMTVSCTDEYDCNLQVEKPEEVAGSEYLATFDVLKSYINSGETSPFLLAANMSPADFTAHETAYSTLVSNFQGVDIGGAYMPGNYASSADFDFGGMLTVADAAEAAGVTLYGGTLCSNQGQPASYYNSLLDPVIIPFVPEKGRTVLFNFEDDAIGTVYPMSGNSTAVVEADPDNADRKVLHVGTPDEKAAYSYPKFNVKLPEGRKLGDYVSMEIDMRIVGTDGLWGAGMRVFINGQEFALGVNAQGLGCNSDQWNRGALIRMNDATAPGFVLPASLADLTEFELMVGSASGGAQYYLDNIIMNYEVASGGTTLIDFEDDAIGTTYPMTGNSYSTVTTDPAGGDGHVLQIGDPGNSSNRSYPQFKVQLQPGRTLKDYTAIAIDMYIVNSMGIWGDGVRVIINGVEWNSGKGPGNWGCPNNAWGRGLIYIPFGDGDGCMPIPEGMEKATEITLAVGAGSGSWHGYMDNITLYWKMDDTIIEKTPEEKADIMTEEMKKWIGGMIDAAGESVTNWNIISEPLSQTVDASTFNWGEYLGTEDYARQAVKIARDTATVDLQLYVSNTFEQSDDMATMANQLVALVDAWEADGVTKIDGYNILLHAVYSKDATIQATNESKITALLNRLQQTGKAVRISDLSVCVENSDGTMITAGQVSTDDRIYAAKYLSYIMDQYRGIISTDKQAGISLSGLNESSSGYKLCPWTAGWNRNYMYEGVVNGLTNE